MVRALLGPDAISERKLEFNNPLIILGVETDIKSKGVAFRPAAKKVQKWLKRIEAALPAGRLTSGEASKLAGALQWASQSIFRKLGRAMIRPINR